jgi:hypothetical protein
MKRITALLAATVLSGAGWIGVAAQDVNEADIFNSENFTQSVTESLQSEQKNKLEYLFGGVFLANSSLTTTAAFDGYGASGGFSGKVFGRMTVPRYGSLYLGYILQYQGTGGSITSSIPSQDLFTDTFTLSEFYLSFDLAKTVFFRVGTQLIAWGPSTIWTPVDFINLERINPLASVDLRIGKPSLRVHVPMKNANLFLFTDFSAAGLQDVWKTTQFGLRGDLTAVGFEFGLTAYLGYSIQNRYGFDFSGRVLATDVYGELALYFPYGPYVFSYAYSLGFQRTLGELKRWTLQGEFFYNSAGEANNAGYSTPASFVSGGFVPLYVGRMYAYLALTRQDLIGTFLDGTLYGIANISDFSYTVSLKGSFDIAKFIPFSVSLAYTGGGAGKEFTIFTGDNGLSVTLEVRFEF